jgi:3D-(3,5/4)-trihydroxycyclohexane-1,2-dione acylhydrolase (decyclizing)
VEARTLNETTAAPGGKETMRLTAAQALVRFLQAQYSERDGNRRRVIPGMFGIFGHGNVAGIGQALGEVGAEMPFYQPKNEQSMVHAAIGFAKANDRLATLACTSSIGPGATNMITGAATATVNRIPVLLLPSDTFANRRQGPVLQQLEHPVEADVSVSDCFRPVSRFFDRITRPEQLLTALPEAIRVLLDPSETGAVTITLHQDVQAEAYDYPVNFFRERTWAATRRAPDDAELEAATEALATSERPLLVCGGGARYAAASEQVAEFSGRFGVPVVETFAGKSATSKTELLLGGLGVTGTQAAYEAASRADVVLCVGTRLADFATGSHSIFAEAGVRFVGLNVNAADAYKLGATPLVADARLGLEALTNALADSGWGTSDEYRDEIAAYARAWSKTLAEDLEPRAGEIMSQGQALSAINAQAQPGDAVVAAAGSPPGDLLRLWDTAGGSSCFLEFGFSCMGHEIPAGLGLRMGRPDGEIYVVIGDGTYLMANTELVTALQEGLKITLVLLDNHGYQCIRALQLDKAGQDFGNEFREREGDGLTGDWVPVDLAANAQSLGCTVFTAGDPEALTEALAAARQESGPTAIVCPVEPYRALVGSETFWDVAVAEASGDPQTVEVVEAHQAAARSQRFYY